MKTQPNKITAITGKVSLAKLIAGILISIVTAVWAASAFFYKQNDAAKEMHDTVQEISVTVKMMKTQQDSLLLRMDQFDGQLEAVHGNTILMANYVEAVYSGIKEDLRTRKDAELQHYVRITSIIEEGLKKKSSWTPLNPSSN